MRLQEEFVYVAVILDAHSRRVIGWAVAGHLGASLAVEALRMALSERRTITDNRLAEVYDGPHAEHTAHMLTTNQQRRNPTARERRILTALASGASRPEAALQAGLTVRAVTAILERLRDRFAPTMPPLIALAVKLEWISVPIWTIPATHPTPSPHHDTA